MDAVVIEEGGYGAVGADDVDFVFPGDDYGVVAAPL
jgi:hypothetical protein